MYEQKSENSYKKKTINRQNSKHVLTYPKHCLQVYNLDTHTLCPSNKINEPIGVYKIYTQQS